MIIVRNTSCLRRKDRVIKSIKSYHQKSIEEKLLQIFEKNTVNENSCNAIPWPTYKYTGSLRPFYPLTSKRHVPPHISRPDYADHPKGYPLSELVSKKDPIKILSKDEIENMRVVCKLARECLNIALEAATAGVNTDYIDEVLHNAVIERHCYPSPLNYYNFPKSCCTSINEVICHGIPDQRPLENGDIINIDVSCYYNGFHGDVSETVFVGDVDEESKLLTETAYNCLMKTICKVKPGLPYSDVGKHIGKEASMNGYSVTRSYGGHGINQLFHTNPSIPHHADSKAQGIMEAGHVFTIEPMINLGVHTEKLWPDDWTVVTTDGRRSAQFEHTVLVTETGVDILTRIGDNDGPYFRKQIYGEIL